MAFKAAVLGGKVMGRVHQFLAWERRGQGVLVAWKMEWLSGARPETVAALLLQENESKAS
jgi:hypothetical protein